jgi:methylated-DNA-[protein]-cysteine S-methyltransferase
MTGELQSLVFEVPADGDQAAWGWIGLVASATGLRLLTLPARTQEAALLRLSQAYPEAVPADRNPLLLQAAGRVRAYLLGDSRDLDIPIDLAGHPGFAQAVWQATLGIPYGETRTYRWVAGRVGGGPGAAQAAGAALGDNPVPLVVPCHRVIGTDGTLHGFAGGLDMKARLLALESGQMVLEGF